MMTKTHNASECEWQRINASKRLDGEPLSCKGRKKGGKRQEKRSGVGDRSNLEDCAVYFLATLASLFIRIGLNTSEGTLHGTECSVWPCAQRARLRNTGFKESQGGLGR